MWEAMKSYKYSDKTDYTKMDSYDDSEGLVVRNLKKIYDNKCVVDNLSFQAPMGKCTGILGVNGAGKTTTFRMLTREVIQNNGRIFADNVDCDTESVINFLLVFF